MNDRRTEVAQRVEANVRLGALMRQPLPRTIEAAITWYWDLEQVAKATNPRGWEPVQAWLGTADLFYLLVVLLKRRDALKQWLLDRCREVQAEPNGYLDVWSREHYKSSIITFALTILDILRDPEITIGIFSHTSDNAKGFLRQIKQEFETNEDLYRLYPEILYQWPAKESPKWSEKDGIVVRRKGNPKEATVEAWGLVDGQPTGKHFRLRVYDDVVTRESVMNAEAIKKTTSCWELSNNLGVSPDQGGLERYIGTRYCTVADTRITMADWSQKRIADVVVGDEIIGWEQREGDGKRYLVRTPVLHIGSHPLQSVSRYGFSNGRSVTCTADHRWWRGAQWKTHGSSSARAHRKNGNEYSALGFGYHELKHIRQLLTPVETEDCRDAAWLAGFFDGEGTVQKNTHHPSGVVVFIQSEKNRNLVDHCQDALGRLGFEFRVNSQTPAHGNTSHQIAVCGGWRERYRFLAQVAPVRRQKIANTLFGQMMTERLKLTNIDDAGKEDVFWLQTGTGNYVAEGFCSANSLYDTYSAMLARKAVVERRHPATHNGRFDGRPVFFSEDVWQDKLRKQGRATVAAQLLQNPMADEGASFRTDWLQAYEVRPRTLNVYIMCDPSRGRSATSDNTAISVVGVGSGGAKYLLDGACHRMTLSQRWQHLRGMYRRWSAMRGVQHVEVGYERYGAQSDDEYFQEQMEIEHRRNPDDRLAFFPITELNWPREGGNSKQERVERLEPDFRNGRFYLPLFVSHEGSPASWRVDRDPASARFGDIEFLPGAMMTKSQMQAMDAGSGDLICKPIIVRDPQITAIRPGGGRYDVTKHFISEFSLFPFGAEKDLVDSVSRIYDMEPISPMAASSRTSADPPVYSDGF